MTVQVRQFGVVDYQSAFEAMQAFNNARTEDTPDEIWLLQHPPVYTLGLAGKPEHLLQATDIPLVKIDRGGQITYHGPGQIVVYLMLDLKRHGLGVRELVRKMENSIISVLAKHQVVAKGDEAAPGVYVESGAKIAALGLRVRRGCTYHGLSLNVDMDLAPFSWINPCGYQGLQVTQTKQEGILAPLDNIAAELLEAIHQEILPATQWADAPAEWPVIAQGNAS
ncbi:lipoyl(octanoyl) transferase LipB [Leeia sp. TBRC 13508]|uniref:Octanoyltransferase n=1 Tax=Leeia speluncae TaxID=2884804 RepID=A0ABS8D751_9NEIS|nr:lipoyl(octanoyl) transferase LipB [Leeia speluncae]MCB6184029.1 lipoyl(octanoyl) transferase LipB [Leeia speluncae]